MYPVVYLNGKYVPKEQANLNVADLSILRGYGIFDYFRYADGKPRFMQDHLERFFRSADILGLEIPASREELRTVISELIKRNEQPSGGIRFVLTGGYSADGYTPGQPNLVGMAYPFHPLPAETYEKGVAIALHHYERQLPEVKSIDYLEGVRIQPLLRKAGADYALYVDREYNVRESDRSNYLIVREGILITPKDNILLGITRMHVLRLARELGIYVDERPVSVNELRKADEVMLCSSAKGVLPVTTLDGNPVANGQPGEVTQQLIKAWKNYLQAPEGRLS